MKIVVFGPQRRVGALAEDRVTDINRADASLPARLDEFIEAGGAALEKAQRAAQKAPGDAVHPLGSVSLHAPWARRRIAMVGGNYPDHLAGMNANMGRGGEPTTLDGAAAEARKVGQWGFWKVLTEVAASGEDVPFPKRTKYLDYEGEVAIIIGRSGKDIPAARWREFVWGVTLVNDWSIRDERGGPPRPMSYNLAKNFDRSCTMGPCIVAGDLDPENIDVETRVNGQVRQHFNTRDMVFKFGEVLELLSRDFTFVPGDVISGGTAAGTAADQTPRGADGSRSRERFLKPGDVVEISSPQIGSIRNRLT
jgi:2-keto-4-pentenoate hydratase/2-oxohepta-3-ene-1,7-dioic acid hydratase in catechol pathway